MQICYNRKNEKFTSMQICYNRKNENFQMKNFDLFYFFRAEIRKKCILLKTDFYYIKVGFDVVKMLSFC